MSLLQVPVSYGELIDKITILQIKSERIKDPIKQKNVKHELTLLMQNWQQDEKSRIDIHSLWASLRAVNERLWEIEDNIREKERLQSFDAQFIQLARSVYIENDERARLKKEINQCLGSTLIEEKSYQEYHVGI